MSHLLRLLAAVATATKFSLCSYQSPPPDAPFDTSRWVHPGSYILLPDSTSQQANRPELRTDHSMEVIQMKVPHNRGGFSIAAVQKGDLHFTAEAIFLQFEDYRIEYFSVPDGEQGYCVFGISFRDGNQVNAAAPFLRCSSVTLTIKITTGERILNIFPPEVAISIATNIATQIMAKKASSTATFPPDDWIHPGAYITIKEDGTATLPELDGSDDDRYLTMEIPESWGGLKIALPVLGRASLVNASGNVDFHIVGFPFLRCRAGKLSMSLKEGEGSIPTKFFTEQKLTQISQTVKQPEDPVMMVAPSEWMNPLSYVRVKGENDELVIPPLRSEKGGVELVTEVPSSYMGFDIAAVQAGRFRRVSETEFKIKTDDAEISYRTEQYECGANPSHASEMVEAGAPIIHCLKGEVIIYIDTARRAGDGSNREYRSNWKRIRPFDETTVNKIQEKVATNIDYAIPTELDDDASFNPQDWQHPGMYFTNTPGRGNNWNDRHPSLKVRDRGKVLELKLPPESVDIAAPASGIIQPDWGLRFSVGIRIPAGGIWIRHSNIATRGKRYCFLNAQYHYDGMVKKGDAFLHCKGGSIYIHAARRLSSQVIFTADVVEQIRKNVAQDGEHRKVQVG